MGKTAAFFRLVGAARVFARHDALVPEEFRDQIPFSARLGARLLRLTTFGGGKGGRLGERFTAADVVLGSCLQWGTMMQAVPARPEFTAYLADESRPEPVATLGQRSILFHLEQYAGGQNERYARKHLVCDTEERPQGIDTAQWIHYPLIQKISPSGYAQASCYQTGGHGIGALHGWNERSQQILQHETSGTCSGIYRCEDEQRLKQNGKVIPECHHGRTANDFRQDLRHADRQRWRATGTRHDAMFTDMLCSLRNHLRCDIKTPLGNGLRCRFG